MIWLGSAFQRYLDFRLCDRQASYETKSLITKDETLEADNVPVELADGRVQEITLSNLKGLGKDIAIQITESRSNKMQRSEATTLNGTKP